MIIAGTGHRPNKLGGYSPAAHAHRLELATNELKRLKPDIVISGMALGWDQALAQAAANLEIKFWAYLPFLGQDAVWPAESRIRWHHLCALAEKTRIVSPGGYSTAAMQARNQAMVDDCDQVLALWDGTSGGTANCVRYAKTVNKPIINCWEHF